MKLTPEQLRQNAAAMMAVADGKPIQMQVIPSGEWFPYEPGPLLTGLVDYPCRPAPQPITRPWSKPEDVPGPVCWLRADGWDACAMIIGIQSNGIVSARSEMGMRAIKWVEVADFEHSTDRINWKPCEVTEP